MKKDQQNNPSWRLHFKNQIFGLLQSIFFLFILFLFK